MPGVFYQTSFGEIYFLVSKEDHLSGRYLWGFDHVEPAISVLLVRDLLPTDKHMTYIGTDQNHEYRAFIAENLKPNPTLILNFPNHPTFQNLNDLFEDRASVVMFQDNVGIVKFGNNIFVSKNGQKFLVFSNYDGNMSLTYVLRGLGAEKNNAELLKTYTGGWFEFSVRDNVWGIHNELLSWTPIVDSLEVFPSEGKIVDLKSLRYDITCLENSKAALERFTSSINFDSFQDLINLIEDREQILGRCPNCSQRNSPRHLMMHVQQKELTPHLIYSILSGYHAEDIENKIRKLASAIKYRRVPELEEFRTTTQNWLNYYLLPKFFLYDKTYVPTLVWSETIKPLPFGGVAPNQDQGLWGGIPINLNAPIPLEINVPPEPNQHVEAEDFIDDFNMEDVDV